MYEYKAVVTRVIDGDTLEVDIDLGFKTILKKEKVRLLGVDTPELRSGTDAQKSRGKAAKELVESILPSGTEIVLVTQKDRTGKYGRYLGKVYIQNDNYSNTSLADILIENKMEK